MIPDTFWVLAAFAGLISVGFAAVLIQYLRNRRWLHTYLTAIGSTSEQIVITDTRGVVRFVNPAFERISGYRSGEILGESICILRAVRQDESPYVDLWNTAGAGRTWTGDVVSRRKDGTLVSEHMTVVPVKDRLGRICSYACVKKQLSEEEVSEGDLAHLAYYDPLTGLPNRLLFSDRLTHSIAKARREGHGLAVIFGDIDRFKHINDNMGHAVGDVLLQQVARRLSVPLREVDTVARVGGDEFIIVLGEVSSVKDAEAIAGRLLESMAAPFIVNDHELLVAMSMGLAMFPDDGTDGESLVRNADAAMYRVKEQGGKTYQVYGRELASSALDMGRLAEDIRSALAKKEFVLFYQPRIDSCTDEVLGAEALIRWQHPKHGLVYPSQFLEIAESEGSIVPITEWVLRNACLQIRAWRKHAGRRVRVAVNMSGRQLHEGGLVAMVKNVLSETKIDPGVLELEFSEVSLMQDPEISAATLRELKCLGVQTVIDDFGTGSVSLTYLRRFSIDTIKISQSLITGITRCSEDSALVRAAVSVAHSMGMRAVAKGVETLSQLQFLRGLGCDEIQGYFVSRPVPPEEFQNGLRLGYCSVNNVKNAA